MPVPNPLAEEALRALCPELAEDFLMALRYHYYVKGRGLVPDSMYDAMEKEFLARPDTDEFESPILLPGSDNLADYSDRVKCLALYLAFHKKAEDDKQKSRRKTKKEVG